ncbi:MAG: alkaline phosphatase D family protein, partial [Vicinamibacterales bacterium]
MPEPRPNAPFAVDVGQRHLLGRLAPAPGSSAALTFGFGSCHMPFAQDDAGRISSREADAAIYPAIRADLRRAGAQLFLLVGDQIYADQFKGVSVRDDLPDDLSNPPPHDDLVARYRRVYRGFFNEPGLRGLRDTFPTLCIWDDHDIFDNWGSTAEKTPTDYALFAAACRAYAEYQDARNPGGRPGKPPFSWIQRWGDIAIVGLDLRGARDYEHGTMLGATEWEWLQNWLESDDAAEVATLFVVSGVPVAHASRWFTRLFDILPARFSASVRDRWTSTGYIASRDLLLDALVGWESRARRRQVIILSGDVHAASAFTIRQRDGDGVIQQVTSSAMTTPLSLKQMFFNRLVVHQPNLLERRYRFERHFLSLTHNYCGVLLEPLPDGGHRVIIAVRAWDSKHRRLHTVGRLVT